MKARFLLLLLLVNLFGLCLLLRPDAGLNGVPELAVPLPSGVTTPDAAERARVEQQILQSTVLIQFVSWRVRENERGYDVRSSGGMATLIHGRYLVTHNHYVLPVATPLMENYGCYVSVTLYDGNGRVLLQGPLTDFPRVAGYAQTMVLEVKKADHRALLADRGIQSANLGDWRQLLLALGREVAQLDCEQRVAHIHWVTVDRITYVRGIPVLVLDSGIHRGASGGGVYWQGRHIANNWLNHEKLDCATGQLLEQFSVAALNEAWLLSYDHSFVMGP